MFGRVLTFVGRELSPEIFKNHKDFDSNEAVQEVFYIKNLALHKNFKTFVKKIFLFYFSSFPCVIL